MTALIVVGSIVGYLVFGFVGMRPALAPLYAAVDKSLTRWPLYSSREVKATPERIMRYVAFWYLVLALLWPLTVFWLLGWGVALRSTPQYRSHVDERERERLERELAEAQQTIASFDRKRGAS